MYRVVDTLLIADITPPKTLLRLVDREALEYLELADSIRQYGVLLPILVRQIGSRWGIVDGLQRYTAAADVGLTDIPVNTVTATDEEALILAIETNAVGKETLPCEYASHLRRLLKRNTDLTIAGLSQIVKKSPMWIGNCLLLNNLDDAVKASVNRGEIPLQSAYLLAKIPRHVRGRFVQHAQSLSAADFRPLATDAIRAWKEEVRLGRMQTYFPEEFKAREKLRTLTEIREERAFNQIAARTLEKMHCKTPLEGWRAAMDWMVRLDPDGLAEQKRAHQALKRGESCEPTEDLEDNITPP